MSKAVYKCDICGEKIKIWNTKGVTRRKLCGDCWNTVCGKWLKGSTYPLHETYDKRWDVAMDMYLNHIRQKKLEQI
jgi:hypothetical protein